MNFSLILYLPLTLPPPRLPLPHPFPPSVPPSLFNRLRLHLPQCCSRLFGRPDGPVARRRWLNGAHRTHWVHCAFDEALHLSHSRAFVCNCVCVVDGEGTSVCFRAHTRGRIILCALLHLCSSIFLPGVDSVEIFIHACRDNVLNDKQDGWRSDRYSGSTLKRISHWPRRIPLHLHPSPRSPSLSL